MSYRYQMTNTLCIFIFLQPLPLTIYLKLNFLPPPSIILDFVRSGTTVLEMLNIPIHVNLFFFILVESDESFSVSGVQGM